MGTLARRWTHFGERPGVFIFVWRWFVMRYELVPKECPRVRFHLGFRVISSILLTPLQGPLPRQATATTLPLPLPSTYAMQERCLILSLVRACIFASPWALVHKQYQARCFETVAIITSHPFCDGRLHSLTRWQHKSARTMVLFYIAVSRDDLELAFKNREIDHWRHAASDNAPRVEGI
jgi:hypothetical protein